MEPPPAIASDYLSPARQPGVIARIFPELAFYSQIAAVVWRSARKAKAGSYDDRAWMQSSLDIVGIIERLGGRIVVENPGVLSRVAGPAVVVGNHMSTLETFVLPSIMVPHRRTTFVVKQQLVETPVFKHVMISRNPVVVGRANPREDLRVMLEEGEARLREGMLLVVFPQTTRAASFTPAEFNTIAVKVAKRAGVPVVPLALRTDFWGIGKRIKDCGPIRSDLPVRITFGEPLEVTGTGREAHDAVVKFVSAHLHSWGVPIVEGDAKAAAAG